MKKIDLGQSVSILANVGVIAGIAFLAIELRQNTNAIAGQSRQALNDGLQQEMYEWVDHSRLLTLVVSDDELSLDDKFQLDSMLTAAMSRREFGWRQFQSGTLDPATWAGEEEIISLIVGTKRTRDWWNRVGRLQFAEDFAALVSGKIETEPLHPYWDRIQEWQ